LGHQARTTAPGGRSCINRITAGQPPLARCPITTARRQPAQQSQPARRMDRPRQARRHPGPPRRRQPRTHRQNAPSLRHHRQSPGPALHSVLRLHVLRPHAALRSRRPHQNRLPPARTRLGPPHLRRLQPRPARARLTPTTAPSTSTAASKAAPKAGPRPAGLPARSRSPAARHAAAYHLQA
jgi:hypothetical protein